MSVKRVLQYGEKSLREPSKEVHKVSKKNGCTSNWC